MTAHHTKLTLKMLGAGDRLGPYRIEKQIGAGGMGRVFLAVDTRLDRKVAIKVSLERFSERFEREARATAALSHPHICTLHDVGTDYLVLEYIEGESLEDKLKRGPLPLQQAVSYGMQVASALAAAHARGIVHRDLKPSNIMLTRSGVKVLDFGLAKSVADQTLTIANAVLGTPAYMAPEQSEGREADHRSDIYALGLILRKMATGKREAPVPGPPHFAHVTEQCLAADPDERWQSAADVYHELRWCATADTAKSESSGGAAQGKATRASTIAALAPWMVAAVALAGMAWTGSKWRAARLAADAPAEFNISLERLNGSLPVPSPDDRMLAFRGDNAAGQQMVFLRSVDSVSVRPLEGTEGAARTVFWSPDGEWIGFFAQRKLKKIRVSGGPAFTIAPIIDLQDADWGEAGEIIFRQQNRDPLMRVSDAGGVPQPLTRLDAARRENSHRFPQFLPGGRQFLFVARCAARANDALYLGSLDSSAVTRLMPAQSRVWYAGGTLLYYREGSLVGQTFDLKTRRLSGAPTAVVTRVGYKAASIDASFRVSRSGRVIVSGADDGTTARFVWFNRAGEEVGVAGGPGSYGQPRLSPSGDRLVFNMPDPASGNRDVYYLDFSREIVHRLTTNDANDWFALWSPDGRKVVFGSDRADGRAMSAYMKPILDESGPELPVAGMDSPSDWSSDGRWIVGGNPGVRVVSVTGGQAIEIAGAPESPYAPRFSPDAKWIVYSSDDSGRSEIYARRFTGAAGETDARVQISGNGGESPVWNSTGRELYYLSGDDWIYAVNTSELSSGRIPAPAKLFRACPSRRPVEPALSRAAYAGQFDTRDGNRFVVTCRSGQPDQFTVLRNWPGMAR